jgi:tape measure domain-containing protein
MAEAGELKIKLSIDAQDADNNLKKIMAGIKGDTDNTLTGVSKSYESQVSKITSLATKAAGVLGAAALGNKLMDFAKSGVEFNRQMENYSAAFTSLLGSTEATQSMLGELQSFAASTPFELTGLADAAKTMLSFGIATDEILPSLRMLGDISGGNQQKLQSLALVMGQISSAGKMTGQDLMQMINAGFNPLNQMVNTTGKSMSELKQEMSDGNISFQMVTEAMKSATQQGGLFFNSMTLASKTLDGQLSTMQDNMTSLSGEIMEPLTDALSQDVIPLINEFLESFDPEPLRNFVEDAVDTLMDLGESVGPVIDALKAMLPAIETLTAAWIAYKAGAAIGGVMDAVNTAIKASDVAYKAYTAAIITNTTVTKASAATAVLETGVLKLKDILMLTLTGKITAATGAQLAWNAVMAANPIGVILGLIALLVTGLGLLSKKLIEDDPAYQAHKTRLNEIKEAMDESAESAENFQRSVGERTKAYEDQNVVMQSNYETIARLTAMEELSAVDKQKLLAAIAALNNAIPDLNLSYDELTGKLSLNNEQLFNQIEAQGTLNAVMAEQENLLQGQAEEALSLQRLNELNAERVRLAEEYNKTRQAEGKNLLGIDSQRLSAELKLMDEALEQANAEWETNKRVTTESAEKLDYFIAKVKETKDTQVESTDKVMTAREKLAAKAVELNAKQEQSENELQDSLVQTAAAIGMTVQEYTLFNKGVDKALGEFDKALKDYEKTLEDYEDKVVDIFTNINGEDFFNDSQSIQQMIKNQNELNAAYDRWNDAIGSVRERLLEMGYGAETTEKIIREFTSNGIADLNNLENIMNSGDIEFTGLADGVIKGFEIAENTVEAETLQTRETLKSQWQTTLEEIAALIEKSGEMTDAMREAISKVEQQGLKAIETGDWNSIGTYAIEGISAGIRGSEQRLIAEMVDVGKQMERAIRAELKIQSPSKVFEEIGQMSAEGLIVGWEDMKSIVSKTISDTTTDIIDAEIRATEKQIEEVERKNEEIERAERLAAANRKVNEAKTGEERAEAQKDLNELLSDIELEATKERLEILKEEMRNRKEVIRDAAEAINDLQDALIEALTNKYNQELKALAEYYDERLEVMEDGFDDAMNALEDAIDSETAMIEKSYDNQLKELERYVDAKTKEYERDYEARIEYLDLQEKAELDSLNRRMEMLDAESAAKVKAIQDQIDAIDALTEAEERAEREADYQKDLEEAYADLYAETDPGRRIKLQEKIDKLISDKARENLLEQRDAEKDSLKVQIEQIKSSFSDQQDMLKKQSQYIKEYYDEQRETERDYYDSQKENLRQYESEKQNMVKESLEAEKKALKEAQEARKKSLLEQQEATRKSLQDERTIREQEYRTALEQERLLAQTKKMIIEGNQQEIQSLLETYENQWYNKGQRAGDAYLAGIEAVKPSIYRSLDEIMSYVGGNPVQSGELPVFDNGGIVSSPTLGKLAMNGMPEAIIPLDKLPGIISQVINTHSEHNYDQGIKVDLVVNGTMDQDIGNIGYMLAEQIRNELRSRGITR